MSLSMCVGLMDLLTCVWLICEPRMNPPIAPAGFSMRCDTTISLSSVPCDRRHPHTKTGTSRTHSQPTHSLNNVSHLDALTNGRLPSHASSRSTGPSGLSSISTTPLSPSPSPSPAPVGSG